MQRFPEAVVAEQLRYEPNERTEYVKAADRVDEAEAVAPCV
jgi:hypothetical protein